MPLRSPVVMLADSIDQRRLETVRRVGQAGIFLALAKGLQGVGHCVEKRGILRSLGYCRCCTYCLHSGDKNTRHLHSQPPL